MLLLAIIIPVVGALAWVVSKGLAPAKRIVLVGAGVGAAAFAFWILLWVRLFACFPAEQVYVTSVSPDGRKAARFSVKYEGLYRWLPDDIEPQYYVTVTETTHGRILLRRSGFAGDLKTSFSDLAKKHAAWAVTNFAVDAQ